MTAILIASFFVGWTGLSFIAGLWAGACLPPTVDDPCERPRQRDDERRGEVWGGHGEYR